MPAPIKKLTREQELKQQLKLDERDLHHQVEKLDNDYNKKRLDAQYAALRDSGALANTRNDTVASANKVLKDAKMQIAQALIQAQRKAQSDHDKACNSAQQAFEAIRADADAIQAEKGAPIREHYEKTRAGLETEHDEKVNALVAAHETETKELRDELEAILAQQHAAHEANQAAARTKQTA